MVGPTFLNTEENRHSLNLDFGSLVRQQEEGEPLDAIGRAKLLVDYGNRLLDSGHVSRELVDAALTEVRLDRAERERLGLRLLG